MSVSCGWNSTRALVLAGLVVEVALGGGCRAIAGYAAAADGAGDVSTGDAPTIDHAAGDQSPDVVAPSTCAVPLVDSQRLVARYTFDAQGVDSWTVASDGAGPPLQVQGDLTAAQWSDAASRGGCGKALRLDQPVQEEAANTFGVIPETLKPASATIEVWVRFARTGVEEGILSRDAAGTPQAGHLSLQRSAEGRPWARLQRGDGTNAHVCARQTVAHGRWVHLRLDYGGPSGELALYVDGVRADYPESFVTWVNPGWSYTVVCGDSDLQPGVSPADNPQPWLVGASGHAGQAASVANATDQLVGEIDELRFFAPRLPPPTKP